MGYVEDLKDSKHGQGRNRWRARWRDPAGRQRTRSFARKVDKERFLLGVEDAKLRAPAGAAATHHPARDALPDRRLGRAAGRRHHRAVPTAGPFRRLHGPPGRRAGRPPGWPLGPAPGNLRGGRVSNRGRQQAGVGVTKTYERRTVRLPRFLCEQVGAYLVDRPHAPNDLVFTMLQGGPLRSRGSLSGTSSRPPVPLVCRPPASA